MGGEKKEGEGKDEAEELPDAEEFLMEQTQFFSKGKDGSAKKGGRPRKKDLDELHRQEHDGVCCSRGGDHRHVAHHSVQCEERRLVLHPAEELLQPDQSEGAGG